MDEEEAILSGCAALLQKCFEDGAAVVDDPSVQIVVEVLGREEPANTLIDRLGCRLSDRAPLY